MSRLTRSALRILLAAAAGLLLLYGGTWVALMQPFSGRADVELRGRADPAILERHVRFLAVDAAPRNFLKPETLGLAADYIARTFAGAGAAVTFQEYVADGTDQRNIIARLGPAGPPRVIVGAHYDVYALLPGADDNASGVAGLLEVARLLADRDLPAPLELVAFSTEEPPFFGTAGMGSAHHAATLRDHRAGVAAMISLEMIGYYTPHQPVPSWPFRLLFPSTGDFILVAGRWADREVIGAVKAAMLATPGLEVQSYCGPTAVGTSLSDHRSFWEMGVPAVMITDTAFVRNPNYHTGDDTPETLDYPRMALTVDGVARAVLALLAGE